MTARIITAALLATSALAFAAPADASIARPGVPTTPQKPPTCSSLRCPSSSPAVSGPFHVKPARPSVPRPTR